MTHLLVCVWRRKGNDGAWEKVAGPMPVFDGVQVEAENNQKAVQEKSGWQYNSFPAGGDPNHA